jgi:polyisoprenoid-binding protein YceI
VSRAAALLALLQLAAAPAAGEAVLRVDPARSRVSFTLEATLHTVRGTGRVVSGELRFDPAGGPAAGAVVVDARSFATGIAARDRNMHEQVLESARFPEIRFEAERLEVRGRSASAGEVTLHGHFEIHGSRHAFAVPARVALEGDGAREGAGVRVDASFRVPYVDWGMRDVSNLVLRVADEVDVQLELRGAFEPPEPGPRVEPESREAP